MKKPLVAGPSPRPNSVAYRSATARAPARSPTRSRRADLPVAAARQRDDALVVLVEQRLAEPRHALGPGQVGARQEPAQAAPADLASGRAARDAARAPRSPMPRRSSLTGSRCPGSRARSGRGRADGPPPRSIRRAGGSIAARPRRRRAPGRDDHASRVGDGRIEQLDLRRRRRGGGRPPRPRPMNRTAPYRPLWSVAASPVSPSSTARSTSSSGGEAPSRNEKLVWAWSSA